MCKDSEQEYVKNDDFKLPFEAPSPSNRFPLMNMSIDASMMMAQSSPDKLAS
jgi:hypothetical protein